MPKWIRKSWKKGMDEKRWKSEKTIKNLRFFKVFSPFQHFASIRFFHHFRIHFGIHFWSIFGPNPLQNLFKKPSKKYIKFCIDFSSIFNGFGTPFSTQVGPCWRQVGHLGASWACSCRSWAPSWLQGAPQAPPRASRTPPDLNFHRFGDHFSKDLGQIFNVFSRAALSKSRSARWRLCARSALDNYHYPPPCR